MVFCRQKLQLRWTTRQQRQQLNVRQLHLTAAKSKFLNVVINMYYSGDNFLMLYFKHLIMYNSTGMLS